MAWRPDYISVADLKAYKRMEGDDAELALAIAAASRAIDKCCGRQFGKVDAPEARVYDAKWDRHRCMYVVAIDDLATVTGSLLNGVQLDVANLYPRNAVANGKVWTELRVEAAGEVSIVAPWGWPSIPTTVQMATRVQSYRFSNRRDSPYGVAGSPENGSELRLLSKVDADVEVMLGFFKRLWGAA